MPLLRVMRTLSYLCFGIFAIGSMMNYFGAILRYKNNERYPQNQLLHLWHGQEMHSLLYIFQVDMTEQETRTVVREGNPCFPLRCCISMHKRHKHFAFLSHFILDWVAPINTTVSAESMLLMSLETLSQTSHSPFSEPTSTHTHNLCLFSTCLVDHCQIAKEVKGTTYAGSDCTLKDIAGW